MQPNSNNYPNTVKVDFVDDIISSVEDYLCDGVDVLEKTVGNPFFNFGFDFFSCIVVVFIRFLVVFRCFVVDFLFGLECCGVVVLGLYYFNR